MRLVAVFALATSSSFSLAQEATLPNSERSWETARSTLLSLCKTAPLQEAELHYKGEIVGHYWLQCPGSFRFRVSKELLPGFLPFELATNSNEAWWARPSLEEVDLLAAKSISYHYWDLKGYDIPILLKIFDPKLDLVARGKFRDRFKMSQNIEKNKAWVNLEVPERLVLERIRIGVGIASSRPEEFEIVWPFGLGLMTFQVNNWKAPKNFPPRLFVPKIPLEAKGFKQVP